MRNKNKKVCVTLNYIENFLTLIFAFTGCISVVAFASLVDIPTEIMSSTIRLNICGKKKSVSQKLRKRK